MSEGERNTEAPKKVKHSDPICVSSPTTGNRPKAEQQSAEDPQGRDGGPSTPDEAVVICLSPDLTREGGPHLSKSACAEPSCATYADSARPAGGRPERVASTPARADQPDRDQPTQCVDVPSLGS